MTNEQYHSDTSSISKSGLDKIESSPLDYWWHYLRPEREPHKPTEAMIFGTAVHSAILEPNEFQKTYVVMPPINKRTNIGKAEFASLTSMCESNGQVLIDPTEYSDVLRMRDAIFKHPTAKLLFQNGIAEQTFMFQESNTGAKCKIRPDWLDNTSGLVVDLKTTEDATPNGFAKSAWEYKYYKQDPFYLDGLEACGNDRAGFVFVNIEKTEPFKIGIHYLDGKSRQLGRDEYLRNCETYVKCLENGIWKGYEEKISEVSLPAWAFNK
jgi:hypothetical protein